jgi:immunity protein, SdpI family
MNLLREYRAAAVLIGIAFVATALLYGQLPDPLPMGWTLDGHVDRYLPKRWGAWIVPGTAAVVIAVLAALLTPKRTSTTIVTAIAGLMLFCCGITWYAAIHPSESPLAYAFIGVGAFLIVVGNISGKLSWSYFVGIRTPWTVDDPHVWERTHRAAGPVFIIGGIAILGAALANASATTLLVLLVATSLYPVLHSYFIWRRTA